MDIIDRLIQREGGYVNHPRDKGGPTKYGITLTTLAWWKGRDVTAEDVAALSLGEAREIYQQRYLTGPGFDGIPYVPLRELLFDCAVHHGIRRAVCWLQVALGVRADGTVGPETRAALATADGGLIHGRVLAMRIRFVGELLTADPKQAVFAKGWLKRIAEFV